MEEAAGDGQRHAVLALGARMRSPLTDLTLEAGLLDAVRAILSQHPTLTASGFDDRHMPTKTNLLDYRGLCEVQGALDYLEGRRHTIASAKCWGSYGLKHNAESWHRSHGREVYVSNGAFLIASMMRGYSLFKRTTDDLNRAVGIHRADVNSKADKAAVAERRAIDAMPNRVDYRFGPVALPSERGLPGQEAWLLRSAAK